MSGGWIVPFQGRHTSCATKVNFLYVHERVYVSDNHLSAAWCWAQQAFTLRPHSILHIDAHYDTRGASAGANLDFAELRSMDFDSYVGLRHPNGESVPAFAWDNYLSIYYHLNRENVERVVFATHGIGTRPDFDHEDITPEMLIQRVRSIEDGGSWVVNLDLDFFVSNAGSRYPEDSRPSLFQAISDAIQRSKQYTITIALSPDCTGSWEASEKLLAECQGYFGLNLTLPSETTPS